MIFIEHSESPGGNIVTVDIKGYLDSTTCNDFEDYINRILEKNKTYIIINASGLEYVSSAGIGAILFIHRKVTSLKGALVICDLQDEVYSIYKLLGFEKILKIAGNRDEAAALIEKHIEFISNPETARKESIAGKEVPAESPLWDVKSPDAINNRIETKKTDTDGNIIFEHPLIVECAECKHLLRAKMSGSYICPECHVEFSIEKDQTIIF